MERIVSFPSFPGGNLDFSSNNDIHELACFFFTKNYLVLLEFPQDDVLPYLMQFSIRERRKKRYISQIPFSACLPWAIFKAGFWSPEDPTCCYVPCSVFLLWIYA